MRTGLRALLLASLVSCGSTKVATVPAVSEPLEAPRLGDVEPRPMPWTPLVFPGEYAVYDLKVRGLVVGEVELATGKPGLIDGVPAHYVVMRGTTAGLADLFAEAEINVTAEISADPKRPQITRGTMRSKFRGRETSSKPKTRYKPGLHNPISALVGLRGWRAEPGDAVTLAIGKRGRTVLTLVAQRARVRGPFRRPAKRLVGLATSQRTASNAVSRQKTAPFEVWISDDRDRVPLLVRFSTEYGDVTLELVGYRRPRG